MSGKQVSIKRVDLSIGKLASVWPMAFHCVSGHALSLSARMRFAANSLYHTKSHTISRSVKHKNGLGSFPIGRRRGMFSLHPGGQHACFSCNNFAWQEQRCYVVWGFCWMGVSCTCRLIAKFRIGVGPFCRASVRPSSRLCAVTLAQINKSVCLHTSPAPIAATVGGEVYTCSRDSASRIGNVPKSQFAFVWITTW